jgi:hypothetical protein
MLENGNDAAIARWININDDELRADAHRHAQFAVGGSQRTEELNSLPVQVDGDKSLAVRVERADGGGFAARRALECQRRTRLESKEKIPDRRNENSLERDAGNKRGAEQQHASEEWTQDHSSGTKAEREAEQCARRHEREKRVLDRMIPVISGRARM